MEHSDLYMWYVLISFETNPSKVRGFAENKEILAFEIVNVSPETCFE